LEDGKNAFAVDFYEMREPSDGAPSSDDDSSLFASPELPRVPIGSGPSSHRVCDRVDVALSRCSCTGRNACVAEKAATDSAEEGQNGRSGMPNSEENARHILQAPRTSQFFRVSELVAKMTDGNDSRR